MKSIVIYGPPASGKSTITDHLEAKSGGGYRLFPVLKIGTGRADRYRVVEHLDDDELIIRWTRYGNSYGIDRTTLIEATTGRRRPIVHLGDPGTLHDLIDRHPDPDWLVVELMCPRPILDARLRERTSGLDLERRTAVLNGFGRLGNPDLSIDTSRIDPGTAGELILIAAQRL